MNGLGLKSVTPKGRRGVGSGYASLELLGQLGV